MVWIMGFLVEGVVVIILICFLLHGPVLFLWYLSSVQPDSHQMSHLHARKPLAVHSGHIRGFLTIQE